MAQYLEFLQNHPGLALAFVAICGGIVWTFLQGAARGVSKVGPLDATRLINHDDAVILDVRGEGEYKQGHILNSVHIPQPQLAQQMDRLARYRDRPIITACQTGQRSAKAGGALRRGGFEKVYTLSGGILAWEGANLPLTRK